MSAPVFIVPAAALSQASAGDLVPLDGSEGRHAVSVLRTAVGERVDLVDGVGHRAPGVVDEIVDRQTASVRIEHILVEEPPNPRVAVVQALPKGDRGERAVELLTEVGVDEIVPWSAAHCVAQWRGERLERGHRRWRDAAHAAAKQARRSWFPVVAPLASTSDVLELIRAADLALVLHEEGREALAHSALPASGQAVVVVGPEGGLTDGELQAMAGAGARIVRLGPTVLRTSTAGVAAVAALLAPSERWARPVEPGMG